MSKIISIYKITNTVNGKLYIGQSINPKKRWSDHIRQAKAVGTTKKYANQYISKAIAKYGKDNFKFEVIDFAFTQAQADCIEDCIICLFDTVDPKKGYNIRRGGNSGSTGLSQRQKQSETMRARYASGEIIPWNKGLSHELHPLTGIPRSDEVKRKISEKHKSIGHKPTIEALQNASFINSNRIHTEKELQKRSDSLKLAYAEGRKTNTLPKIPWNKRK